MKHEPCLIPSHRHCVVHSVDRFNLADIRRMILRGDDGVQADFQTNDTALPAAAKTAFAAFDNGRRILIAVCLRDLTGFGQTSGPLTDTVELLVSPWNDGIGYYQFLLTPDGACRTYHFTPYSEAHSTAHAHLALDRSRWILPEGMGSGESGRAAGRQSAPVAWLFAEFEANALFCGNTAIGFNLARCPGGIHEPATWNPCSGHGMQDASSFGRLYRTAPLDWGATARIERTVNGLRLAGGLSAARKRLTFRLADPLGEPVAIDTLQRKRDWEIRVPADATVQPGRYRLYAESAGVPLEPRFLAFDIEAQPAAAAAPFAVAMTWDVPDDIRCDPLPYTPDALAAELDLMRDHGINRIHWIDYPPETLYSPKWTARSPKAALTRKQCGDLLPLAAKLARERDLAFIGVFKPFDIAIDGTHWHSAFEPDDCTSRLPRNLEGRQLWVPEAVAKGQNHTQRVHDEWCPSAGETPAKGFRLYSRDPLPTLKPADLRLWVSADNRNYAPYQGPKTVRVRRLRRSHQRWTAAGNIEEPARETVYALEIDGLRLKSPYLALEIKTDLKLSHRAHAFAEAWDAAGDARPVTLATAGNPEHGFTYFQEWMSWANTSPRMLEDVCWGKGFHGLVFDLRRTQPTLLEPCCEEAREIWLSHVRRILETEADGACIRTLCHHNNVMDYMMMAFHPAVREQFRAEHGREPEPTWEDAVKVRELRGRAYTDFLRGAKTLAGRAGKTLAIHLEAGIEVPPALDQRMQFNLEWETWIREGIADELVLKWWFSQNPFIHEHVLPLARRHGIPVHIVDRNCSLNNTPRAIERAEALLRDSRRAGFAGYAWYEAANCKRRNTENVPEFRAHIGDAIRRSAETTCVGS